ncbi:MAG: TM2 domain-containing protein [Coprobacillaceae bacterium]
MECKTCGNQVHEKAFICPKCGVRIEEEKVKSNKSRIGAGLLAIFLGFLGAHNFYLGRYERGVTQFMLTIVVPFIFMIVSYLGLIEVSGGWLSQGYVIESIFAIGAGSIFLLLFYLIAFICPFISFLWAIIEAIIIFVGKPVDGKGNRLTY